MHGLLVPGICHTIVLDDFSSPFGEVREGFEACEDGFGKISVVPKGVDAEDEGRDESLKVLLAFFTEVLGDIPLPV